MAQPRLGGAISRLWGPSRNRTLRKLGGSHLRQSQRDAVPSDNRDLYREIHLGCRNCLHAESAITVRARNAAKPPTRALSTARENLRLDFEIDNLRRRRDGSGAVHIAVLGRPLAEPFHERFERIGPLIAVCHVDPHMLDAA